MQKTLKKIKYFFKSLSKKQKIFGGIGFVVVIIILFLIFGGNGNTTIIEAEVGNVDEEVLVTGQTKASSSVELGFEQSGRVTVDNIDVGTRVTEGQTLIVLDQSELLASLAKAKANLDKALVELASTKREAGYSSATAQTNLIKELRNAYIKADDAVRNDTDQFFKNPREYSVTFDPSFVDGGVTYLFGISSETKSELSSARRSIELLLESWEQTLAQETGANLDQSYALAKSNLEQVQSFLNKLATAMNSISSTDFAYDATVQGYKTTIGSARTSIVTAISNLITAKEKYDNAPYEVSGTTGSYNDVLVQEAQVESLRADIAAIEASLGKTVLRAPINGIVTQADAKRGEIVTVGTPLVSIISDNELQIEANLSEINIGRVKVNDRVVINFDAFLQDDFEGTVSYIDPAETIIDAVPTYKITVSFVGGVPENVRSGLTANLRILTASKSDVVKIPVYAVERKDGKSYIQVVTLGGKTEEREITVGLRGKDGSLEVVSGLSAGEKVLVNK